MATPTETTTKPRRGAQPGPALREARRKADEERRRADELQKQLDELRRRGPDVTPPTPTETATEPPSVSSASSDDPLDEPPPPPPPPSKDIAPSGSSSGESSDSDEDDHGEDGSPSEPTSASSSAAPVGDDAVRGLLAALLGQVGVVNRYLALKLLRTGALKRARRAGADDPTAEQLADAYLVSVGKQVSRIAEFSATERAELIRVLTPKAKEFLEDADSDTLLWVTVIGIYAGKFVQLSELVDFGADVSDAVASDPAPADDVVDVTPPKDPT